MSRPKQDGFSITEVLVACAVATVVVLGVSRMEAARMQMERELRLRMGAGSERVLAGLGSLQLGLALAQADRIVVLDSGIPSVDPHDPTGPADLGHILLRRATCPAPATAACLDNPANYHWDEYRLTAGELQLFTDVPAGCGAPVRLSGQITSLTFRFPDGGAQPPPGSEPFAGSPDDNNLLEYAVTWADGPLSQVFRGTAEGRAIAYSKVGSQRNSTIGDSGTGIDVEVGGSNIPPDPC